MGSALGHPQAALAPDDAGDLLDQVLLGWPERLVLLHQCSQELAVFLAALPRQDRVAGEDAMARRVEARQGIASEVVGHRQDLLVGRDRMSRFRSTPAARGSGPPPPSRP